MNTLYAIVYTLLFVGAVGALLYAFYRVGKALAEYDNHDDNWPHGGATGGA